VVTNHLGALLFVMAGAISLKSSVLALRTRVVVWLWERGIDETFAVALR